MTARGYQRRSFLSSASAVVLVSSTGCSLLYDLNTTQCETTADCRALGEAFANTTCYNRVCVEKTPDAGEGGHAGTAGGAAGAGGGAGTGTGPAGQGGAAGGASFACDTNEQCIEQHQDQYFVCKRHECVAVVTDECPELIPEDTAQGSALDALKKDPVLLGAFSTMNPTTPHESVSVLNWELALTEFNEKLLGGLPSPSGRRPLMAVVCQAQQPDVEESMGHLVGALDVPAILSSLSTADLLAAFELTDPDGLSPVFFMSARSADLRLATLQDNGMLWHMLGNPRVLAVPTVALLQRAEPYVNARRQAYWDDRATTGSTDDPGKDRLRVLLIYSDDPTVEDIATVLTTDDDEHPENMLFFNGMNAIDPDNAANFGAVKIRSSRVHDSVNVAAAIQGVQELLPHVIVGMATTEFATAVIPQIESNWDAWTDGQQRPYYVLSHMLVNDKDDLVKLASETFESVDLGSRMVGVNYAQNADDELYRSYLTRLQGAYYGVDPADLTGYENYYDAAYYLLYSVAAANRTTYSGADIRDALTERVIFGSEPLDIGPNAIASTVRDFGNDPSFGIELTGTMGPPNFDRATGTRVNQTAAWCIGQPTPDDAWQLMPDVVLFDATTRKFEDDPIPCVDGL
jgi:hypothetical protein